MCTCCHSSWGRGRKGGGGKTRVWLLCFPVNIQFFHHNWNVKVINFCCVWKSWNHRLKVKFCYDSSCNHDEWIFASLLIWWRTNYEQGNCLIDWILFDRVIVLNSSISRNRLLLQDPFFLIRILSFYVWCPALRLMLSSPSPSSSALRSSVWRRQSWEEDAIHHGRLIQAWINCWVGHCVIKLICKTYSTSTNTYAKLAPF